MSKKDKDDLEYSGSCSEEEPCGNEDLPGWASMGSNLLGDARGFMENFLKGKKVIVPKEVAKIRYEICEGCEFGILTKKKKIRCTKCGCYMAAKVQIASSICPLEIPKWKEWEKENE